MLRFLRTFSSDRDSPATDPLDQESPNDTEVRTILSEMDGSFGWIRLEREDINKIIFKWDLDIGFTMNGSGFQEHPFGIVKKLVVSDTPLDHRKILRWFDLAHRLGYDLALFEPRNCIGPGILVDSGDVLTLPYEGRWKHVAQSYKWSRERLQAVIS